jgi:N-alpha-acetyltransferase 40
MARAGIAERKASLPYHHSFPQNSKEFPESAELSVMSCRASTAGVGFQTDWGRSWFANVFLQDLGGLRSGLSTVFSRRNLNAFLLQHAFAHPIFTNQHPGSQFRMGDHKRPKRTAHTAATIERSPRAIPKVKLVETVNALPFPDFMSRYVPHWGHVESCPDQDGLYWHCGDANGLLRKMIPDCLELVELTSRAHYEASEIKWSSTKKRKEMELPDMKYLIATDREGSVQGFVSFMVTYEDGYEVVYIYEIHFAPNWQGKGMGKRLMAVVEDIAHNVGVAKVMLTVFRANDRAISWYFTLGYQEDEFSPGPRKLRNGTIKQPSYAILSKPTGG